MGQCLLSTQSRNCKRRENSYRTLLSSEHHASSSPTQSVNGAKPSDAEIATFELLLHAPRHLTDGRDFNIRREGLDLGALSFDLRVLFEDSCWGSCIA